MTLNNDPNQTFNDYSCDELKEMLKIERSVTNRNLIRQIIRNKKRIQELETNENNTNVESIVDIEILKEMLNKTENFFEKCQIRSQILNFEKQKKVILQNNTSESNKEETNDIQLKQLIINDLNTSEQISEVIIQNGDDVELIWKLPYKVVRSIQHEWEHNSTILVGKNCQNTTPQFTGTEAKLTIKNVNETNNGIYSITIHSQRLSNSMHQFYIVVNNEKENEISKVLPVAKPKEDQKKIFNLPPIESENIRRTRVSRNRATPRCSTLTGTQMANSLKELSEKNNFQNGITNQPIEPPKLTRRIHRSATTARDVILTFCQVNTDTYYQYGVCVENLSSSWNDGLAFCALVHNFYPTSFDFTTLCKTNRRYNFKLAFDTAEKYGDIPQLLDIEDMMMTDRPDWKCVFTYLQWFYKALRNHPNNKLKTIQLMQ